MTEPILQALAKRIAADVAAGRDPDFDTVQEYNRRTAPKPPAARKRYGAPLRNLRVEDDLWARVTEHATQRGITASDVVRNLIDTLPPTNTPDGILDRRP